MVLGGIPPVEGELTRAGGGQEDPRFRGKETPQGDVQTSHHGLGTFRWRAVGIACVCTLWSSQGPTESPSSFRRRMKRSASNSPTGRGAEAPSTARRHAYSNVLCDRVANSEIRLCECLCQLPSACREEVRRKEVSQLRDLKLVE